MFGTGTDSAGHAGYDGTEVNVTEGFACSCGRLRGRETIKYVYKRFLGGVKSPGHSVGTNLVTYLFVNGTLMTYYLVH